MSIIVAIIWLVLCFVVASGAKNRNRSYGSFFVISLILSPLISFFILIALGEKKSRNNYSSSTSSRYNEVRLYQCPHCFEKLSYDYAECPHCLKKTK